MLQDKVYLWLVIISCLGLIVAGTLCIIEIRDLQDTMNIGPSPFPNI